MDVQTLQAVGLSAGEIRVYSAMLDLGTVSVNSIHEATGIERRNIYDILNKLIGRGLVTYINENKKRYFRLTHPKRIVGHIEEKIHELQDVKQSVEMQIPALEARYLTKKPRINAEVYRGVDGIKAVWEDTLNYKRVYWIGSGRYVPIKFPQFFAGWNRRRIKLGVRWLNLMRHELRKERPMALEKIRFLPHEFSTNPTVICIYGDKVVNFLFGDDLFAFLIESKELAQSYRLYHKYLWDRVAWV